MFIKEESGMTINLKEFFGGNFTYGNNRTNTLPTTINQIRNYQLTSYRSMKEWVHCSAFYADTYLLLYDVEKPFII